jgi:thiamine pyrophosphate-dependent acetolactate synthase large subunit-like protein
VALLGAAATATQTGIGAIASDDPHFVGLAMITSGPAYAQARREADVILAVGCRFSPWVGIDRGSVAPGAAIIQVSTDGASLGQNVALELGLLADAKATLSALVAGLKARGAAPPKRAWLHSLAAAREAHRTTLGNLAADTTLPMHPAALAEELGRCLPKNALVTFDGGHTTFWSNDFTPALAPRTCFNEVGMTQLGFGLPFALALALHNPGAPVVNITGDGAFGFTVQELDTARRYGLPVVNVIHNNASWGVIKRAHQHGFGFTLGDDLDGSDYAAIARGFGGFGEVVTERAQLKGALERAFASKLPAVIDCRVRFESHPGMPDFGRMGAAWMPPPPGRPAR